MKDVIIIILGTLFFCGITELVTVNMGRCTAIPIIVNDTCHTHGYATKILGDWADTVDGVACDDSVYYYMECGITDSASAMRYDESIEDTCFGAIISYGNMRNK